MNDFWYPDGFIIFDVEIVLVIWTKTGNSQKELLEWHILLAWHPEEPLTLPQMHNKNYTVRLILIRMWFPDAF